MLTSLVNLYKAPYNKQHPVSAIVRFSYWKIIRSFKLKNVTFNLWKNKKIFLNFDSFQSMWIMYNYIVDWEEFNLIKHYIRPDDQVADVGANMGFYTIWMSKFIDEKGMIHSFEPDTENFKKLERNCALNNLKNVKLNKLALSDENGHISFTRMLDGENHISLSTTEETVVVESLTFDNYCNTRDIHKFSYVKVDIEGFELFFLKGAHSMLLNKKIDIIQMELNTQVKNSLTQVSQVLDILVESGYFLCKYDVEKKCLVKTCYTENRENYFAVSDFDIVNKRLSK